jgi:hypothetical protein
MILDDILLVDVLGHSQFSESENVDAFGRHLTGVDPRTLAQLIACIRADFSDNSLSIEPFAAIPNLRELDLSSNAIKSFSFEQSQSVTERPWAHLQTLNIGYNALGQSVGELQRLPALTTLNLSHNGIAELPTNLMRFTSLTNLNLAGNTLNSEWAFFSLATIPALRELNLDGNQIVRLPRFEFGFENLALFSIRSNKIETADDISTLVNLPSLAEVNICKNPLVLRFRSLSDARKLFKGSNISLITRPAEKSARQTLVGPLRTVAFDPLTLPSFAPQHYQALNKKHAKRAESPKERSKEESSEKTEATVFITGFGSVADENQTQIHIPPTPLPTVTENEFPNNSVWNEVPVTSQDRRVQLTIRTRSKFEQAVTKLAFVVSHPEHRLKPRESPSTEVEPVKLAETPSTLPPPVKKKTPLKPHKKHSIAGQLAARTEYTKTEIQRMLISMEERIAVVETDMQAVDESGQSALETSLDQRNFTMLHKQYETIRAELINTLNS